MLIVHVFFSVNEADRANALETLLAEAPTVLARKGCISFTPVLDPTDPARLGIVEEWAEADAFEQYTSSREFAEIGKVLRPLMTAPPVSRRFDAQLIESVN